MILSTVSVYVLLLLLILISFFVSLLTFFGDNDRLGDLRLALCLPGDFLTFVLSLISKDRKGLLVRVIDPLIGSGE